MNNRKNLLRLLLFVSLSFVAVILNGQTVSKTFKNEALKTVLKEVEKQTGLSVIYKIDEVNAVSYTHLDVYKRQILPILLHLTRTMCR